MGRAIIILVLLCATALGQSSTDKATYVLEATAKVSTGNGAGTGWIVWKRPEATRQGPPCLYLVTNQHVVGRARRVNVEFEWAAIASPRFRGDVIRRNRARGVDVAVIRVLLSEHPLLDSLPVLRLPDGNITFDDIRICTAGCRGGEKQRYNNVTVDDINNGLIYYRAPSRPGDSGSSLVDFKTLTAVGLVAWTNGQQGIAQDISRLRSFIMQGTSPSSMLLANDTDPQGTAPPGAWEIPLAPPPAKITKTSAQQQELNNPWDCPDGNCPLPQNPGNNSDDPWVNPDPINPRPPGPRPPNPPPTDPAPTPPIWDGRETLLNAIVDLLRAGKISYVNVRQDGTKLVIIVE